MVEEFCKYTREQVASEVAKAAEMVLLSEAPSCPVEKVFCQPKQPCPPYEDTNSRWTEEMVPLDKIIPTQDYVYPERVRFQYVFDVEKIPTMIQKGEFFLVWNGHHRTIAMMAHGGEAILSKVYHP